MSRRLTISEFERIKSLVADPVVREKDRRREEQKSLSDARKSRWPNTLEAQRERKLEDYKQRLAAHEARRQKIDREEDERKANKRRERIEYAAQIMYAQTDKIKRLASAELVSECLAEREKQVELKQKIVQVEKKWEEQFEVMEKEAMKKMEEREIREMEERCRVAKEIAEVQTAQLDEIKKRHLERLNADLEEGKRLAAQAAIAIEEEVMLKRKKAELGRLNALKVEEANEKLKEIRRQKMEEIAREDQKLLEYAQAKMELKKRQIAQQNKIEALKQKRRQQMIDEGTRRLAEMQQNNNERIEAQVAEARAAEDERERIKAEKRALFEQQIRESRDSQMAFVKKQKELEYQRDVEFSKRWREHNKATDMAEQEELEAERRAAKEHQQVLILQAQEKREKDLDVRRQEIFEARALDTQAQEEEEDFKQYAARRIEEFKSRGLNTYPLRKCVAEVTNKKFKK